MPNSLYRGPERRSAERRVATRRISSAGPVFDILALMTCRAGYHMEGSHKLYTTVVPATAPALGRYYATKSAKGYPWDIRPFDANMIYSWGTEFNWTSPNDIKAAISKTAIPWMYRYAYIGDVVSTLKTSDSQTGIYSNCKLVSSFNLGMVRHEFVGPFTEDLGGTVGTVETYKILYRWSGQADGTYKVQETFTFAPTYGLVGWQTQNWNATIYGAPTAKSFFNTLVLGTIAPKFPCTI